MYLELALLAGLASARYADTNAFPFDEGLDLEQYQTEPNLRPPKLNVTVYNPAKVAPGSFFIAPYESLQQQAPNAKLEICQVGPHIYDSNGEPVWSGACKFHNRNVFDFKKTSFSDRDLLTFIAAPESGLDSLESRGAGIVLDSSYNVIDAAFQPRNVGSFDMHEFSLIDEGRRSLQIVSSVAFVDATPLGKGRKTITLADQGFQERDTITNEILFEWRALDHIGIEESTTIIDPHRGLGTGASPWDWFHQNSIDKDEDGNYFISARYTDAIYKINGKDGSVMWRLGGTKSDFKLEGFNFYRQHDCRVRSAKNGKTMITFLNNGADDLSHKSDHSAGFLVEVDTNTMVARLVRSFDRPDGGLTMLRGNAQMLDNGNIFMSWSENGYVTEFDGETGEVVMEAQFDKHRLVTYRAYKFEWKGFPADPPVLKADVHKLDTGESTTSFVVSWNGATEVASYRAYEQTATGPKLIGEFPRTGFETEFNALGAFTNVFVEAVCRKGNTLGSSVVMENDVHTQAPSRQQPVAALPPIEPVVVQSTEPLETTAWQFGPAHILAAISIGINAAIVLWLVASRRRWQRIERVKYTLVDDAEKYEGYTEVL